MSSSLVIDLVPSSSVAAELAAASHSALYVPHADRTVLQVTGEDRIAWLQGLLSCDLANWSPDEGRYGLCLEKKGKIVADLWCATSSDGVWLSAPTSVIEVLLDLFAHHLVMEDVECARQPQQRCGLVHGPRAVEICARMRQAGAVGGVLDQAKGGSEGVLFLAELAHDEALAVALRDVHGRIASAAGGELLRLEQAVPRFGADFGASTYPQEAGLEKTAVSFSKGCYLGQEVVCMLAMRGRTQRTLIPLVLHGPEASYAGQGLYDAEGKRVGEVTSSLFSPLRGAHIALAMVHRDASSEGTSLWVKGVGEVAVQVVASPAL